MATVEIEQLEQLIESETERVFCWRRDVLLRAGYTERWAFKLALRSDVDLHVAEGLLGRGCPEELAVRILT